MKAAALLLLLAGLLAPVHAQDAPPRSDSRNGTPVTIGTSHTLESAILAQTRTLNVYLPPGYAETDARYPVLYLLDGGVYEDFFHIAGLATLAADYRKIRPFIVVGIEGIDRRHDFTSPSKNAQDQKDVPTAGGAATFRRFLSKELKPFVETRFRTTDETVLIGESLAGLFVAETFLEEPELFGSYICVSPSLWWDDGSLGLRAGELVRQHKKELAGRRIYLTIADEGGTMREGFDRIASALEKEGPETLRIHGGPMQGETHGTIFHPAALAAIRTLFATAPPPEDEKGSGD